jgi:cell division protein FtsB
MRAFSIVIALLLAAVQYPLWIGKGGWSRVVELRTQLVEQRELNVAASAGNVALGAELANINAGREAVEERARHQLHMLKADEMFFQWVDSATSSTVGSVQKPSAAK